MFPARHRCARSRILGITQSRFLAVFDPDSGFHLNANGTDVLPGEGHIRSSKLWIPKRRYNSTHDVLTGIIIVAVLFLSLSFAQEPEKPGYSPARSGMIPGFRNHVEIPILPPYPNDAILPASAPVELPGSGGVTDAGQPTYTIPAWTPDGPAGLKPNLSIDYCGGTANGHLGVGFAIGGLSVIRPSLQTVASEGKAVGVNFARSDSYTLDGQKLVTDWASVRDVNIYTPDSGIEVTCHTEVETFQRIVATYAHTNDPQPAAFTVWRRDGLIATYKPRKAHRAKDEKEVQDDPSYDPSHKQPAFQELEVAVVYSIAIWAGLCFGTIAQADDLRFTALPQTMQATVIRETRIPGGSGVTRIVRDSGGIYVVTVRGATGEQVVYVNEAGLIVPAPVTTTTVQKETVQPAEESSQAVVTYDEVQKDTSRYELITKKGDKEVYRDNQTGQKVTVKRQNN